MDVGGADRCDKPRETEIVMGCDDEAEGAFGDPVTGGVSSRRPGTGQRANHGAVSEWRRRSR
jgi:hypothetical protein